jgi:alkane 1-monooxygenase
MTSVAADHEVETSEVSWRDGKRYAWLLGLVVPSIPFIIWGVYAGLHGTPGEFLLPLVWWLAPFVVYVVIPIIDFLFGQDAENPPDDLIEWLEQDRYYRWVVYAYIPVQFAGLILACWMWTTFDMSVIDKVGLAVSVAMVAGIGINTAHELGHKKVKHERWLSKVVLAQTLYGHFFIEHNRGHHVRVATPEDPASARFGESFWRFLPRSVWGSLKSAWELERKRLARMGKHPYRISNDNINAWLMSVALFGALTAVFGWGVLPYLIIQGVVGFSMLEAVNYLEHYGLLRQRTESGRYERPAPRHSWNSNNVVTNVFLYHLQRHSDHHANPTRRYQALRDFEEAPQLPAGYATLIGLAYLPPLWRKVMDKRVLAHYDGDITKANIEPSKREKVLAKYGATS